MAKRDEKQNTVEGELVKKTEMTHLSDTPVHQVQTEKSLTKNIKYVSNQWTERCSNM